MSLGSWDPEAEAAADGLELSPELLSRLISLSRQQQLDELPELISGDESQRLAALMSIPHEQWLSAVDTLAEEDLLDLIRFFAVAENLPGWEAGASSPVIALARCLRKRGVKLDRDLLLWLREVNQNRFLPYGPL